jgi:zinc protease
LGDWRLYFLQRDRIEKVTPSQVKDVAAKYLVPNNRTVGMFIPAEKPQRVLVPATPDIIALVENYEGRKSISAGEAFDATPENIEARVKRIDLPEGIKATLLSKKTRGDDVRLSLTLRYGDENSLKGFESAAGLLSELMLRGTKKLSDQELRDQLDHLGATISGGSGNGPLAAGAVSFSVQAKRETLPAVLDILKQVLREPLLAEDKFDEIKRRRLANLEQSRTEPSVLADRMLSRSLAPYSVDDVRYVPTIDESIERLKNTTLAQVEELYRNYLGSQAGELSIVGDFDPEACLPILQNALSDWKANKTYHRIAMTVPNGLTGSKQSINTPDKANATFMAGMLFPLRDDDPDFPALKIADYLFGGNTLSSRLGDRVRQKEGLSYGVVSNLNASAFDERASFSISAICNPVNIEKVETAIQEEFEGLVADGVNQEELDRAKQGYLQFQKVRRTSDMGLTGMLSELSHQGRTMKFTADLEEKVNELTPEQVAAAVRKHLHPQDLVIVRAGDFEAKSPPADNR